MNRNFVFTCIAVLVGGVALAAVLALATFLMFTVGDTIFATGGGMR
jgi:hypothetical protein